MKKGFTLIELLAVIVILAIIAMIATPIVLGIIEDSRKGAFKNSAIGIVDAGKYLYAQGLLNNDFEEVTFTYTNGAESSSVYGKVLNYKGNKPDSGKVSINNSGKVALAIHSDKYCVEKGYDDTEVTISEKTASNCIIPGSPADASGASAPTLTTGMIPVKWNGTNWIKADVNNYLGANSWYDYDNKIWANAVTVTNTNRATYLSGAAGITIADADINTMWVWIPRYKYAIPSGTGARAITIVFESKTTTKSTGDATGTNYRTHPAFTFGATELSGIWVAKFETTGDKTTPTIKPNAQSIRVQTVKTMYDASRAMENNATYGTGTDTNIHMAKDSEWGTAIYLAYSKYGINTEIYKNNSSGFYTGRSGGDVGGNQVLVSGNENIASGFYTYDGKCATTTTLAPGIATECTVIGNNLTDAHKSLAYNASTTGNIYGIYDLSGGACEYTMSIYRPNDATSITDNSGFSATTTLGLLPTSEYWNQYITTTDTTACNNGICYGHGISETKTWYNDSFAFPDASSPWPVRGGNYTSNAQAGTSYYLRSTGGANTFFAFRFALIKP